MADFGATKWHRITCKTSYNYKYKLIYIYIYIYIYVYIYICICIYIYICMYNDINSIHAMNMTTVLQSSRNHSQFLCGFFPNSTEFLWPPASCAVFCAAMYSLRRVVFAIKRFSTCHMVQHHLEVQRSSSTQQTDQKIMAIGYQTIHNTSTIQGLFGV